MKRITTLAAAVGVLVSATAFAATPGGNLAWYDCYADGGVSNATFACTSNTGSEALVVSWVPSQDFHQFVGAEAFVDVYFDDAVLPAWWSKDCTGRTVGSAGLDAPASASACAEIWTRASVNGGGLAAYNTPIYIQHGVLTPGAANTAQIDMAGAVTINEPQDVLAGTDYFLFQVRINRMKSTGSGACTGCNAGAQLNLQGVWACEPVPAPQVEDYTQGPQATVTLNRRNVVVPTLEHTWGALKAMYR